MKGIILTGGRGTRLQPFTYTGPKQLLPVANKPVLEYAVETLRDAGITDIGIVLGNKGREEIQQFLGDGSRFDVSFTYIVQGNPLGIAHAVGCAEEFVADENFVVYLGDNVIQFDLSTFVSSLRGHAASVTLQKVDTPGRFGIATLDDEGTIQSVVEKPTDPPSDLAFIGIYAFTPDIFDAIADIESSDRGELELADAVQWLLDNGHDVSPYVVDGYWKDVGTPADLLEANRHLLDEVSRRIAGTIAGDATVQGRVEIRTGAVVEAGVHLRGPLSIGEDAHIGAGTYVGPYTAIGADSQLENVHIEQSVVVEDAELTTDERLVDSIIGKGATVTNRPDNRPSGRRVIAGCDAYIEF